MLADSSTSERYEHFAAVNAIFAITPIEVTELVLHRRKCQFAIIKIHVKISKKSLAHSNNLHFFLPFLGIFF